MEFFFFDTRELITDVFGGSLEEAAT